MGNRTSNKQPERLPQRWALIFTGAVVAGAIVFALAGPAAALGAVGATVLGLHTLVA
ncbi:hypothetical protein ACFWD7_41435 [Streptomyces mirabilis]|uniref:hypothetical protein n=1 Tax=Streptomyces mirabilis TaxID=68239 RepID=UPI0036855267